jgi:hypothetical protein
MKGGSSTHAALSAAQRKRQAKRSSLYIIRPGSCIRAGAQPLDTPVTGRPGGLLLGQPSLQPCPLQAGELAAGFHSL